MPTSRPPAPTRLLSPVWTATDHVLAVLAHAAIGFGLFGIGFLASIAVNVVIWLVSRRRPHVAVHAEQAGLYQLFVLIVNVIVIAAWTAGSAALFGRVVLFPPADASGLERSVTPWLTALLAVAVPLFALWYVGTIAFGLLGALRVALGYPFWYPVIGPWARRKHGWGRSRQAPSPEETDRFGR